MERYELVIYKAVLKQIEKLPESVGDKAVDKIAFLADNPRPVGCKKLTAHEDIYRVKVGDYRIIYEINDRARKVQILKCMHRSEVYKR